MSERISRRGFMGVAAGASVVALAGCLGTTEEGYEVWALDQGTNTIYIYDALQEPDEDEPEFEEVDTIDTGEDGGEVPHMIHYSSEYTYAAVACTAGARTLVYRTDDRELVANLETGAGSHFAGFTPDDEAIVVDVIGESKIVRIDADLEEEFFEIDEEIEVDEDIDGLTDAEGAPICHSYDHSGRSIHTLGPSYHDAGLVIVDHEEFTVDTAFPGEELPTNCGTIPHPDEEKFYLTAGLPSDPDAGEDGVGEYYVLDTETDEVVHQESSGGIDAHGFWFAPDGEELWVLNRETNDGVVVDPETNEVVDEIPAFGPTQSDDPEERDAPDIMWFSPDGEYVFVTLRGPVPLSGDPHAATGVTPGFAVLDAETRDILDVVEPDPIEEYDEETLQAAREEEDDAEAIPDFHGIGVRPLDDFDGASSPPY